MSRARAIAFSALFIWCNTLLAARVMRTGSVAYSFLTWNLALASIPAFAASRLARARNGSARIAWTVLWLTFLPNAPYLATDLLHLRARNSVPLWFDVALLFSCAATGVLLGYTDDDGV